VNKLLPDRTQLEKPWWFEKKDKHSSVEPELVVAIVALLIAVLMLAAQIYFSPSERITLLCHYEDWQIKDEFQGQNGSYVDFVGNRTYFFAGEKVKGYSSMEIVRVKLCNFHKDSTMYIRRVERGR
jgi:hypothetical protein